jgi:hypothetical protein
MTAPRFLADHAFNEHILRGVERREPSIDLLHAREAGLERSSDDELLAFAARENWIVLSHDVNTMTAAAYKRVENGLPLAGLFLVSQGAIIGQIVEDIILIWSASGAEEWTNHVKYLPLK